MAASGDAVFFSYEVAANLRALPVTSGVPFPKGALGSERGVQLLDSQGKTLPLQATVTARWADGSVKWLLLDFRHSGPAADYTLAFGPNVPPREPESRLSPPPVLGELVLTDAGGREHAVPLTELESEEGGALRRCWHGRGPLGDSTFSWEARAHV